MTKSLLQALTARATGVFYEHKRSQCHPAHAGSDVHVSAALVLGSGLSDLADLVTDRITIPYAGLDGFPGNGKKGQRDGEGVSGHGKDLVIGTLSGKRIAILTGREHYYENGNPAAMRPALETLAALGAETLILTNAAGSLKSGTGRAI